MNELIKYINNSIFDAEFCAHENVYRKFSINFPQHVLVRTHSLHETLARCSAIASASIRDSSLHVYGGIATDGGGSSTLARASLCMPKMRSMCDCVRLNVTRDSVWQQTKQ